MYVRTSITVYIQISGAGDGWPAIQLLLNAVKMGWNGTEMSLFY